MNFGRLCGFVLTQHLFCRLSVSPLGVPVVPKVEDVSRVRRHRVDVTSDDLVKVLKLFQPDPQGLAQAERVDLALLFHVDVLVDTVVDLADFQRI